MHKGLRYMYNSGPGLTELRGVFGNDMICLQSDLVPFFSVLAEMGSY